MEENKLGEIICTLRKEKKLTQKELADALNVSDKAISRWETGGSSPNLEMMLRISEFFNVRLNDLIVARVAGESDEDTTQEIIRRITEINKKNAKTIKIISIAAIAVVIVMIMVIIFTHSYNRFKVYKVNIASDEIYSTTGMYVETRIKDSLQLGNLKLKNVDVKETDVVSVDLYFVKDDKEYVLQSYSSLDNIYFVNYQSYIKINDLSDYEDILYIKITIIDSKNNTKEYIGKLNFILDFSNNILFNEEDDEVINNRTVKLDSEKIIKILLDNGYTRSTDKFYIKRESNNAITYKSDSNKINYTYEKDRMKHRYVYCLNNNILEVSIFDENNLEIENYKYDVANGKVQECKTGKCNNYEEVLEILNKKVLNLLYGE